MDTKGNGEEAAASIAAAAAKEAATAIDAAAASEDGASAAAAPSPPPKPKVRMDFYQTESDVVVSIFLRGLKTEDVSVEFSQESVSFDEKLR
jgi:HSP20 family molecular chaperone IbpA